MGEETARLRDEIDRTREDLTRDVDLLAEKTSPSRIVERRVQRTRRGFGRGFAGLKEKVMGSSPDTEYRGSYGPAYTDATDGGAAPGQGPNHRTGSSAAFHAMDAAAQAKDAATQAKERVAHAGGRAQDSAHDAVTELRGRTEGNPFAAGLVAFGIGWLVSSLMPASESETQAAERAGEVAREHGGPVMDQAKQALQEVGQELRSSAQDAGQQVKERVQDAAGTVKEEARTN